MAAVSSDGFLILAVALCGILCVSGYLLSFALGRQLSESATRPMISLGELIKPLGGGMLIGMLILAFRLGDAPKDAMTGSVLLSALLPVSLLGVCAGGWTGRPRPARGPVGRSIGQAELVTRLCVAGNSHEEATARIAVRLALAAGYDPAGAGNLSAAASLHDVGKAGIPDAILNKSGALDAAETRVMQNHTRIGHRMMARSREPMLDLAADIALHHHEHWDGSGYPAGLSGERIPLTSRVVALAEMFDRLLSPSICPPASFDEVTGRLRAGAGTQFDPRLVTLLLADLPGMVSARNGRMASTVRMPQVKPAAAWLRPGRFRLLQPDHASV